jgi:uncharacterized repeat protein (TIGR02543 family)
MKKITQFLVAVLLLFGGTQSAFAQLSGSGNSGSPYLIGTVDDLVELNTNFDTYNGVSGTPKYFKLTANIDLTDYLDDNGGTEGWSPIGGGNSFYASFDGDYHVISGLWIDRTTTKNGLIGQSGTGGSFQNLGVILDNTKGGIVGGNNTAGLVGYSSGSASITNCYVIGNITGATGVGGLTNNLRSTISNSFYSGNISGTESVGGLVGTQSSTVAGTISNSYAIGTVTGTTNVGGIIGSAALGNYRLTMTNCFAANTVVGTTLVGGLIGKRTAAATYLTITNSFFNTDLNLSTLNTLGTDASVSTASKKTTSQLQTSGTVPGTWSIVAGFTYPYLSYQAGRDGISDNYTPTVTYMYDSSVIPVTFTTSVVEIPIAGTLNEVTLAVSNAAAVNAIYESSVSFIADGTYPTTIQTTSESGIHAVYTINFVYTFAGTTYEVTFDSNDGSSVTPQTVGEGLKVIAPADPTKSDYVFAGWYQDDETFLVPWDFATDVVTAPITLYAKWIVNDGIWYVGTTTQWSTKEPYFVKATLTEAITAASGGEQVWVIAGTHTDISQALKIGVSLYGGFAGTETALSDRVKGTNPWDYTNETILSGVGRAFVGSATNSDGINSNAVLKQNVNSNTTPIIVDGFTITNGEHGIIFVSGGGTTVQNSIIKENGAVGLSVTATGSTGIDGGGISFRAGTTPVTIDNCLIENNLAKSGGGIVSANVTDATGTLLTVSNTLIRNNKARIQYTLSGTYTFGASNTSIYGYGGGIFLGGRTVVNNCRIEGNEAIVGGGVVMRTNGGQLNNSIIVGNKALYGAGVSYDPRATNAATNTGIYNCLVANNTTTLTTTDQFSATTWSPTRITGRGDGVYFTQAGQKITNSIFVGNTVLRTGTATATLAYSFVDDEDDATGTNVYHAASENLYNTTTWKPIDTFPGTDAGTTGNPTTEDIVGTKRAIGTIDIGPYESTSLVIAANATKTAADYTADHENIVFVSDGTTTGQLTGIDGSLAVSGTVSLVKSFVSQQWHTIGFPFAIASIKGDFGAGETDLIPYAGNSTDDFWLKSIHPTLESEDASSTNGAFEEAHEFTANQGYIIQVPDNLSGQAITFTSGTPVTLNATPATLGKHSTHLFNTYALTVNPGVSNIATRSTDFAGHYTHSSDGQSFTRATDENLVTDLQPFEALLTAVSDGGLTLRSSIGGGDGTTNFDAPNVNDPVVATKYYNLVGVDLGVCPTTGAYIVKQIHESGKTTTTKQIK